MVVVCDMVLLVELVYLTIQAQPTSGLPSLAGPFHPFWDLWRLRRQTTA